MSLSLALNTALSGLNINQQSLAVLSQNIANANTPGYSRKIINQQSLYLAGNGAGVSLESVTRRVDEYLVRAIQSQNAIIGRATTNNDYSDRVQLFLGNPGAGNSLNNYTTRLFNALQSLTLTPEDATFKVGVVNSATSLSQQLGQLSGNLNDLRYQADQEIGQAVTIINSNLKQIHALNKTINENVALGRPVTELQDQRDGLVREISQYMDVQILARGTGSVHLSVNSVSLLDDILYQIQYTPASSPAALAANNDLAPIKVYRADDNGTITTLVGQLATGGTSDEVTTILSSGKIKALIDQRDTQIPNILKQLDLYAATLRDRFNAIHNAGSGFPGTTSYTGTRSVVASDYSQWSGQVRLAVLAADGNPAASGYTNLPGGLPPLLIDLSTLDTGFGAGKPSTQGIINEINQYFAPQNRVQLGNLSNIRLASLNSSLPISSQQFSFDLDLENLSGGNANVFITDVTVLDSDDVDITSLTTSPPSITIAANGFATTNNSSTITITTSTAHGLSEGDTVYLPDLSDTFDPLTDLNNIPLSELSGKSFTISNVTATGFEISATSDANMSGSVVSDSVAALPSYAEVEAGTSVRPADGAITASLSMNPTSPYYTIKVAVATADENGVIKQSEISYRVLNSQGNLRNNRYSARAADGDATLVTPTSTQAFARAILVDADGRELPKSNGAYVTDREGFLKIVTTNSNYTIAIDSLNSAEGGRPDDVPPVTATGRGFSHYFNLNDFFVSNGSDTTAGSAGTLQVAQRLLSNPGLVSVGTLSATGATSSTGTPFYTYQRTIGDNSIIQRLADFGLEPLAFASTGGLSAASLTLAAYAGQIIGAASTIAASAKNEITSAQALADGFSQKSSSISGVNIDEELANTVIYQNSYTASARVVSVTSSLFEALLETL